MSTFNEFAQNPVSEKVILFWVFPKERIITVWNDEGSGVYSTPTDFWVHQVREEGSVLTSGASPSLSAGQFYYDSDNSIVYVRASGSVDPGTVFISFDYKFFYSNRPSNLPYDLNSGRVVHYDGLIQSVGKFTTQIDNDDLTGIALSGNGTIALNNNSGEFEELYDRLFWEGADAEVYLWSPELDSASEAQIIYRGKVDSKSYTEKQFGLKLKDFVDELRNEVPLPSWTTADGLIPDSILGKPKRRLYGQNE